MTARDPFATPRRNDMKTAKWWMSCVFAVTSTALLAVQAGSALAQPYPNKPIKIVVSAPPAGGADIVGRMVGQKLTEAWGQPVVIDNRPGGGGNIGTELTAKSPADGYTMLVITPSHTTNPFLHKDLPYDSIKDFVPITQVTTGSYIVVVPLSSPVKNMQDLVALAKSKKGGISYASSGNGQAGHLGMELLKTLGGFEAVHIPYKGSAPAMTDLLAGRVDVFFATMPGGLPFVNSSKVRAIAVTGLRRSSLLPDVPTVAESGFPGFEVTGWYGLLAPAGTPPEIVAKLQTEVSRMLKQPDVKELLLKDGADPVGSTPDQFAAYIRSEMDKWSKVIKQSGARVD